MSAPLTPPPSSAIEIQDAARASDTQQTDAGAEPIVTDPPTQEPAPTSAIPQSRFSTSYHFLFVSLAELAETGNFKELVRLAERGDLNSENDDDVSRILLTGPLVLSYLILDNLPPARFALSRLPSGLSMHPLNQTLLALVSAVWEKQYDRVYVRARDVLAVVQRGSLISEFDLESLMTKLVHIFVETFQRKTFTLLSKAYSSIPLALAQAYLGLDSEQVLAVSAQHRWSYDQGTQVLTRVDANATSSLKDDWAGSSLATFNSVADSLIMESGARTQ